MYVFDFHFVFSDKMLMHHRVAQLIEAQVENDDMSKKHAMYVSLIKVSILNYCHVV